jgi:group II intron reverse transcriptase/maturase
MSAAKPFCISKWEVWEAYKRVKANQGAAGGDGQSIAEFERNLKGNLYKLWNRMSSGSYFPPPVRTVKIPKANGGERKLGIPTVADRIAQQVVKSKLEPVVDPLFHPDSYGYRPGKSALDAVGQARQRCWRYDWIVDLDIQGFFDNIPQDLLLRAVRKHAGGPWMVLYIERWLKAPVQEENGQLVPREKGTPQGGVISPLLVLLCYNLRAQQNGQQGNRLSNPRASRMRSVAIEFGLCRSARTRGAAGLELGWNLGRA